MATLTMSPDAGFHFDSQMSPRVYLYDANDREIVAYDVTGLKTLGMLF